MAATAPAITSDVVASVTVPATVLVAPLGVTAGPPPQPATASRMVMPASASQGRSVRYMTIPPTG